MVTCQSQPFGSVPRTIENPRIWLMRDFLAGLASIDTAAGGRPRVKNTRYRSQYLHRSSPVRIPCQGSDPKKVASCPTSSDPRRQLLYGTSLVRFNVLTCSSGIVDNVRRRSTRLLTNCTLLFFSSLFSYCFPPPPYILLLLWPPLIRKNWIHCLRLLAR